MLIESVVGSQFGRLVALSEMPPRPNPSGGKSRMILCRCVCGAELPVILSNLRRGNTLSCGCLHRERSSQSSYRHGHSKAGVTSGTYTAWVNMRERCRNENVDSFKSHGGRGIAVCDRWIDSFENFLSDMGERPSQNHSLDRIDNDGHYDPSNCRWATSTEQARNKRSNALLTYNNMTKTLVEWSEISGVKPYTLRARIVRWGWPIEKALQNFDGRVKVA